MLETRYQEPAQALQPSVALWVCGEQMTVEDRNVARILEFFGVDSKSIAVDAAGASGCTENYAIVTSAVCLAKVFKQLGTSPTLPRWITKASSVYVYGFRDDQDSVYLLRRLTGDPRATLTSVDKGERTIKVTADFPGMCGPMSDLQVRARLHTQGWCCRAKVRDSRQRSILRTDQGDVFFELECAGVPFYINTWGETIDINALSPSYFDVGEAFCEAVPAVFYFTWAFRASGSAPLETPACLIVDDPPLMRRYGFMDFREVSELMDQHNFTTTLAFIPWNWRRGHPDTMQLFRDRPEKFSLVVHGCDHTASEFADRSTASLNGKIRTALQRVDGFERRAGIPVDRVMVFPQGAFSPETGRALKLNGFVAAVNTEVAPLDQAANETRIADLWDIAILRYGTFPIFTRRYMHHGIENFAFDGVLGKPCLIASHHDIFRDHGQQFLNFGAKLRLLRWNLVWRSLGQTVRRGIAIRPSGNGGSLVRMFASCSIVENMHGTARPVLVIKEENDPDCVQSVWVNDTKTNFQIENGCIQVKLTLSPHMSTAVRVEYKQESSAAVNSIGKAKRLKVAAVRCLSEFRDNCLSRNEWLYQNASRLKRLLS